MFDFNNFDSVSNRRIQDADIKVFANNRVRIGEDAVKTLGWDKESRLDVLHNAQTGEVAIYATKREDVGRYVNDKREFTHASIAQILGGKGSEWTISGEGVVNPSTHEKWFKLEKIGDADADEPAQLDNMSDEERAFEEDSYVPGNSQEAIASVGQGMSYNG